MRLRETKRFPYGYRNTTGFRGFVKSIQSAKRANRDGRLRRGRGIRGVVDAHFLPQYLHCSLQRGFRYDYYLKLEQMDNWYEPFVKEVLGVEFLAQHFDHAGCFYASPGYECKDMFTGKPRHVNRTVGYQRNSTHSTHSNNKLADFYSPRIAHKVSRLFRRDLRFFGYPQWSGTNPTEYLANCSNPQKKIGPTS